MHVAAREHRRQADEHHDEEGVADGVVAPQAAGEEGQRRLQGVGRVAVEHRHGGHGERRDDGLPHPREQRGHGGEREAAQGPRHADDEAAADAGEGRTQKARAPDAGRREGGAVVRAGRRRQGARHGVSGYEWSAGHRAWCRESNEMARW